MHGVIDRVIEARYAVALLYMYRYIDVQKYRFMVGIYVADRCRNTNTRVMLMKNIYKKRSKREMQLQMPGDTGRP